MMNTDGTKAGLPCHENGWHWGGPSPETGHSYSQVIRGYTDEVIWLYQKTDSFLASSAAYIFVANDVNLSRSNYDMEDALHWFRIADLSGIIFG